MKKNLLLPLLLVSTNTLAANVTILGKEQTCEKRKDVTEIFICEVDGARTLVVNAGYGYTAYTQDKEGKFSLSMVSKVVDSGKTLYETPTYPGLGGMGGVGMGSYTTPDTLNNRKMTASIIANNLKDFKDDFAKKLRDDANTFIQNAKRPKKVNFKVNDLDYSCESGESRELNTDEKKYKDLYKVELGCDYFSCKDKNGNDALAYIPQEGSFASPSILTLEPKGKEQSLWQDVHVTSAEEKDKGMLIYEMPKIPAGGFGIGGFGYPGGSALSTGGASIFQQMYPNTDKIEGEDYLPVKIKERQELYKLIAEPGASESIKYSSSFCSDPKTKKLFEKRDSIIDEMNTAILDENLTQLISLMNGNIVGTFMPTDNIKKYGCRYNGMVISPKAYAHLNYIKRLNENPNEANYISLDQAQDLFNKAKAMDDIPFGYKYDGCYARAHVMARRFEAMGVPTEKVWIKGDLSVPGTDIRWNFHVAPVVTVKDPKDGLPKKYVIDPSLTSKAVPLDEWVATMKPNVKGPIVKTSYPIPVNAATMERTAVALSSSDPYLPDGDMTSTEDQKMDAARRTMKEYSKYVKKD